ncbi:MAG TPA: OmpA family protein [Paracoccaceae bacterium]|nr:OmpA family protein [Paracoccaceae bacterium]
MALRAKAKDAAEIAGHGGGAVGVGASGRRTLRGAALGFAALAALAGCGSTVEAPAVSTTGRAAAAGAVAGGVVGNLVASGGRRAQGTAIGAAIGAGLGALAGSSIERQQAAFERRLAAERARNDVQIERLREDVLLLTLSGGLQFDTGSATLQPGLRESLGRVAEILRADPGNYVTIIGHTDNVGRDAANQALSERRAYAVRNELLRAGVPASSMFTLGRGASEPVADNATAAGRAANRRVELVITRPANR